jgi:hypothetical protein
MQFHNTPIEHTGTWLSSHMLSVLQAVQSSNSKELYELISALSTLSGRVRQVVIQWVPAHCCIAGSAERTDALDKVGTRKTQLSGTLRSPDHGGLIAPYGSRLYH